MKLKYIYRLVSSSLICFALAGSMALSQQLNHFLLEDLVPFRNNPSYTGNQELNDLMIMTRRQWTGFEGAPVTYLLATRFMLKDKNAAIGMDLQNSTLGPVRESGFFLDYSYKVVLGEKSSLYLGLKGGFGLFQINLSGLRIIDPGDYLFEKDINNILLPNLGTGLHFVYKNYYFDFSIPKILRNRLNPKGVQIVNGENREDRTIITGGGAKFRMTNEFFLYPAFAVWLVKGTTPLFEARIAASTRKLGAGFIYRPTSALGGYFYYRLWEDLKIGYAYELPISMLKQNPSGSHEVYIGYNFTFTKQKTVSPRRF